MAAIKLEAASAAARVSLEPVARLITCPLPPPPPPPPPPTAVAAVSAAACAGVGSSGEENQRFQDGTVLFVIRETTEFRLARYPCNFFVSRHPAEMSLAGSLLGILCVYAESISRQYSLRLVLLVHGDMLLPLDNGRRSCLIQGGQPPPAGPVITPLDVRHGLPQHRVVHLLTVRCRCARTPKATYKGGPP